MIFKLLDPWHWKTPEMLGSTSFFSATEGPSTPVQLVACDGHLSLSATTPAFFLGRPESDVRSQQILHVTSRGWLATKPCKVLHVLWDSGCIFIVHMI